jgi:choline dehydrogenase-like flavoprotein
MNEPTRRPIAVADYVVVGTGSAGSVVAARLSADERNQVLVLEAGPKDNDRRIHMPVTWLQLFRSKFDWDYLTEPQPELNGRRIYWPRGKTLGGSSSLNAMMWVRGFAADYDEWARHAGHEWTFSRVVEYFTRIERLAGAREPDEGSVGPLYISQQRGPGRSTAAWLAAVRQSGYVIERPNLPEPQGFSQVVVTQRRGARWSVADAYLRPALRRKNLKLLTEATVTRVIFESSRAVGVEFEKNGRRQFVQGRREVVLCAGAVNSPQLLMLSGIGDREQLRSHGIAVVHHSPQVGENLQDHLGTVLGFQAQGDARFATGKPMQLANYLNRRRGLLSSSAGEAYGFVRSRPDLALPDLELFFGPGPFFDEGLAEPPGHAFTFGPILVKPHSRGRIALRSADPTAKPIIDPRYLSDSDGIDRAAMMEGLRVCAKIADAPPLKDLLGSMLRPLGATEICEETLESALNDEARTFYHPVGTCRMGTDPASVVTSRLEVRGVHGLRVADASVMPTIIRGHTHAPSMVIGAKAADLIADANCSWPSGTR